MERIELTSAEEIFSTPLEHPKMLIEGMLPTGLTVLNGDSKIGKSWMVLMLCLKLAKGEPLWGLETTRSDVVYLALEDRAWRIQDRLHILTDEAPDNLFFAFQCGLISKGLEDQIKDLLAERPNVRIIFIDTLQMVRDNVSGRSNAYAKDYQDIGNLKKIADDQKICIFLVHHTRKENDGGNIFNNASGSTGLMGASDTFMMLQKSERFSNSAVLSITGRDIEEQQIELEFVNNEWRLAPDADISRLKRRPVPCAMLRAAEYIHKIRYFKGTVSELMEQAGIKNISRESFGKMLVKYNSDVFEETGITYVRQDKAEARMKTFYVNDSCDGYPIVYGSDNPAKCHDADWECICQTCDQSRGRRKLAVLMAANGVTSDMLEYHQLTLDELGFRTPETDEEVPFSQ